MHARLARPVPDPGARYVSHVERGVVAAPPDRVLQWIVDAPLGRVLVGGPGIAPVTTTELLTDSWGEPGGRRRVVLADGNTALEEMLSYDRGVEFRYMVWNFTNQARFATDYAVASFIVSPEGSGTSVEWRYSFQSSHRSTRRALERFVEQSYAGMMKTTMARVVDQATRALSQPAPEQ